MELLISLHVIESRNGLNFLLLFPQRISESSIPVQKNISPIFTFLPMLAVPPVPSL